MPAAAAASARRGDSTPPATLLSRRHSVGFAAGAVLVLAVLARRRVCHTNHHQPRAEAAAAGGGEAAAGGPAAAAATMAPAPHRCAAANAAAAATGKQDPLAEPKAAVLLRRRAHFCAAQSVSYANTDPLYAVVGDGQFIVDERGTSFLDTRNNVAHVGWQNPRVCAAVAAQTAKINCNSRYVHHLRGRLAERLLATLPSHLTKVFFVNSGSEANDLALRLARAHSGGSDVVVVQHAYHGHTVACLDISPYKYNHAAGHGRPAHVHEVPCPAMYRNNHEYPSPLPPRKPVGTAGRAGTPSGAAVATGTVTVAPDRRAEWRGGGGGGASGGGGGGGGGGDAAAGFSAADVGARFAEAVREACSTANTRPGGRGLAAFVVESGMSVGGVVLPPDGCLAVAFNHVRAAGGVCIADEVQVGFGRVGPAFWGFALGGPKVRPDIVTMGKPFGNGFPLAAVVTTDAVAWSFANGLEYFNTFGGNPVACAAGLAVLNEIEERGLAQHAAEVGAYVQAAVRALAADPSGSGRLIGDVRGAGLFVGVELVSNRDDAARRRPAAAETSVLCSRLKDRHRILTSIDGPAHNVLVLKPPLVFTRADADYLVDCMRQELPGIRSEHVAAYTHTAT